ncbi:MAG: hypothetical protein JSV86_04600 [Gemmatimonadota bacterium]|nr:MAG: hypothetical protein JSV86_04600 [Gemmatimonadota bacterium]
MELDTTLNLITTVTVIAGVTFAVFEVLHMSARRRQNAALALLQSYETPEFAKAIVVTSSIEWFQWLAERISERESSHAPIPAHIVHRSWRP